ncbi:MAG: trypsin-like peptidase domain-containing protein [Polyangiaceae bacterium]|nr:trypsin-like peptidase domain-containing protein [Polyangiaceae bacterium]
MLNEEWLSTFAAVGVLETDATTAGRWKPSGACAFVTSHELAWLVTANHVLPEKPAPRMAVRLDIGGEPTLVALWEIHNRVQGLGWVRDRKRDLAICVLPNLPGARLKTVPPAVWAPLDMELTTMRCLTGGCPLGLPALDPMRAMPVVLDGIVAGMDRREQRIYLTAPTYPGNSGGPVFVERPLHDPSGNVAIGPRTVFLAGIVQTSGQIEASGQDRALHLGVAAHIQQVTDLLDSPEAHKQAVFARAAG